MNGTDCAYGAIAAVAALCCLGTVGRWLGPLFFVTWLNYALSFTPHPPAELLWNLGIGIEAQTIWALFDAWLCLGAAVIWCIHRDAWWAGLIYCLALTQVIMHGLYWDIEVLPKHVYYNGLNHLFLAQSAILILAGGGGVVSRIGRLLDRGRNLRHTHPSAHIRAR